MKEPIELYSEEELFLQIAAGSEKAFRLLFDLYRFRLFSFCFQLTHSNSDAEEIVQDVFMKLWKNREKLSDVEFPRKYIYTVARNQVLDHLTRVARDKKLLKLVWANLSETNHDTELGIMAGDTERIINKAVTQLPSRKQAIYHLSRREGLSHTEVAQQLGISVSTVKNSLVEILRHIKSFMSRQYEHSILLLGSILAFLFR